MDVRRTTAGMLAALVASAAVAGCAEEAVDEIPPPASEVATPPDGILPDDPPVIDPSAVSDPSAAPTG